MDPRRALSFGAAAEAYAAARPTYPVDALRFVLPPGARRVLDLGAGTGKLTSVLLDLGLEVVAVEPDDAMRTLIDPRAEVLEGTAEDVPVEDGSVDAVVVGQAWHWFDEQAALASVRRVVRPGGTLGLLWNVLDDSDGWPLDLADHIGMEDRLSLVNDTEEQPTDATSGRWQRQLFRHAQHADADLVVSNLASRSIVIVMPDAERTVHLDKVRSVVPDGEFDIPWVTDAWVTTL
ncbi:MAG: class SAM-dependent methyltransferase [Frankiales bacterium]|nr:class SAM-dependent methyltransferase [Frankiales bacterium]